MIRKFLAVLICVLSALSFPMRASETGSWSMYGVFYEGSMQNIIDTERYLYYLSSGWLYAYDKENDENISYTELNDLSDTDISNIYYNYDNKYLLVVYANSNMDVIHEDGNVYNIPDLKNIVMSGSKKINSVDFRGDEAYVATDFGYVVVNMKNNSIKESFIYNKAITSIVALDKYIYICCDKSIYWSGIDDKHYQFSSFQLVENVLTQKALYELYKIDKYSFFVKAGWVYRANLTENTYKLIVTNIQNQSCGPISRTKTGFIIPNKTYYYLTDAQGINREKISLPAEIDGTYLSSYAGDGSFWNVDLNGVKQVKLENGQTTVLHDNFRPNMPTVDQHYLMDMKGNTLTTANSGPNGLGVNKVDNYAVRLNSFKDGQWTNQLPQEYMTGSKKLYRSISLSLEPKDPSSIWLGTWGNGLYNFKDGSLVKYLREGNSPFTKTSLVCDLKFDNAGNLWALQYDYELKHDQICVLPAGKLGSDNPSDWTRFDFGELVIGYFSKMYVDDRYAAFSSNVWTTNLHIVDHNGTPTDTSDDRQTTISSYVDQDGRRFEIGYIYCMKKDLEGRIWIGTNTGIGIINDLGDAFDGQLVVNRVKVARNDGTNLADYLLDGLVVTCLDFDGANRKWVGTQTSGLYLVSADGSEILANYNAENSNITDNEIGNVVCDKNSNNIYVGTRKGLFVYASDAVWAASDYNNVYAYPNPVRPEYSGPVTITGLMDNSQVKIADAAGNVIYSGYSNGGMFVWNLTNMQGSHINTGVYYVLASQSVNGSKDGCVSKILVVR